MCLFLLLQRLHNEMLDAGLPDDVFTLTALITGEQCLPAVCHGCWCACCMSIV